MTSERWVSSGVDAVGLLVAAFLAVLAETLVNSSYSLFFEIGSGLVIATLVLTLMSRSWRSKTVVYRGVLRGASWAVGLLVGIGVKMVLAMSLPFGVLSAFILLVVATWVVREQRSARKRVDQVLETPHPGTEPAFHSDTSWFREQDVEMFSTRWAALITVLGALIGFLASVLLLLYFAVFSDWFIVGAVAGTIALGSLGPMRNRIVKIVASRGFPAAYNLQRFAFVFYFASVVSGAVAVQEPREVLPLATLFLTLLYGFLLLLPVLNAGELGRLYIFQFLVERDCTGRGYTWLQKGLRIIRLKFQIIGVSVKRNALYFGFSYSLFEGSNVEADLDRLYLLGDWSSNPRAQSGIGDVTSWFLNRGIVAEAEGFERAVPLGDYIVDLRSNAAKSTASAVIFAGALVGFVVGVIQLLQYLKILH